MCKKSGENLRFIEYLLCARQWISRYHLLRARQWISRYHLLHLIELSEQPSQLSIIVVVFQARK